jgi:hypothetical protein
MDVIEAPPTAAALALIVSDLVLQTPTAGPFTKLSSGGCESI